MEKFFNPKSIAIIGASATPGKIGHDILKNLHDFNYQGTVYPVNPKGGQILDYETYKSVSDLPEIDLAVIAIPAQFVAQSIEECGKTGVKNIVIISANFREVGEEGEKREEEVIQKAKKYGIRIVGPNCLGVLNPHINMNASFAEGLPKKGGVSLISQSGAMAVAFMDWAKESSFGFSKVVSLGNKSDVNEADILEYFGEDEETKIILLYLEDFKEGKRFLEVARKVAPKKPTIIIKSGRSEAGSAAAASHTGALAGSDTAVDAAFKQTGMIRANSIQELFGFAMIFNSCPVLKNNNIAIITNAGGPGIVTTDAFEGTSLNLAEFSKETEQKLAEKLPAAANIKNPVDVIGDAPAGRYRDALEVVLEDPKVDGVVVILTPQTSTEEKETAKIVAEMKNKYPNKAVTASFIGGYHVKSANKWLEKHDIARFRYPERAVKALDISYQFNQFRESHKILEPVSLPQLNEGLKQRVKDETKSKQGEEGVMLSYNLTRELLESYDFPLPGEKVCKDKNEAIEFTKQIGFPIVMKIMSPQIVHKTDIGGVKVNIKDETELEEAFDEIWNNSKTNCPDADLEGVLIQQMLKGGQEVIVGIKRDPTFGPLLAFGLGGIFVNIFNDATFRVAPIDFKEARQMIEEIKSKELLMGARGEKGVDLDAIARVIEKTSHLAAQYPEISEMDFNPVLAFSDGAFIADAKIIVD